MTQPGSVTLISSGETSRIGGQVFERLAHKLQQDGIAASLKIAVLETPAGFETNASRVAGRVADFMQTRLQNYKPEIHLIAARKRDTPFSPDNAEIVDELYDSQMIFFGPGSPTYTVRQLQGSLAWQIIQASQRLGAAVVLASAATIAAGRYALPVYEIYKVGEDPVWKPGLDLFGPYRLPVVIVPHWNNREGGDEVDTSRCFIGQKRFEALLEQLPGEVTVVGIDEHTALTIDLAQGACSVKGGGQVHILRGGRSEAQDSGSTFPIQALGDYVPLDLPADGLAEDVWQTARQRRNRRAQGTSLQPETGQSADGAPPEVLLLVEARQSARTERNWALADQLRDQILAAGWEVKDTAEGPKLSPVQE